MRSVIKASARSSISRALCSAVKAADVYQHLEGSVCSFVKACEVYQQLEGSMRSVSKTSDAHCHTSIPRVP